MIFLFGSSIPQELCWCHKSSQDTYKIFVRTYVCTYVRAASTQAFTTPRHTLHKQDKHQGSKEPRPSRPRPIKSSRPQARFERSRIGQQRIPSGVLVVDWRACPLDPLRQSGNQSCWLFGPLLGRSKVERRHVPRKGEACGREEKRETSKALVLQGHHILSGITLWFCGRR